MHLLTVHPSTQREGMGRRLLDGLLTRAGATRAWLQTRDAETPVRVLYRVTGWMEVGHGPDEDCTLRCDEPAGQPGVHASGSTPPSAVARW